MATYRIVNAVAISSTPYTSGSTELNMAPDDYGTLIITHSGSRLAAGSTVSFLLQGSMDGGTTWFDIEVCKPNDTMYMNGNLASWCKVVPLAPLIRLQGLNASGITITAWIID